MAMTRRQRRITLIAVSLGVLALAVGLVLSALKDSIVFFNSPTDVMQKQVAAGTRIRLGGLVSPGSLVRSDNMKVQFQLTDGSHAPGLVLDAFLLRSLAVAGYAASFEDCARCTRPGPHPFFNVPAGGAVCGLCRPGGSVSPATETLELLAALLSGDWALADASDQRHRREGSGLVAAYLQWHLERGLRSLPMVERT